MSSPEPNRHATLAFVNGRVHTVDSDDRIAEAVAVQGDRILWVGRTDEVEDLSQSQTDVIDLQGRSLVPGFTENHIHVLETSVDVEWLDLTPNAVSSIDQIVATVEGAAKRTEPGQWILGWGFNENRLREGRFPTRKDLDPVTPENPVALRQVESMSWTANTAGLRRMGIEDDTPNPPGGAMLRDEHGAPLGPMWDNCRVEFIFPTVPQPPVPELTNLFAKTARRLSSFGVTNVNDAGVVSAEQIQIYQQLREIGELSVRVNLNLYVVYGSDWDHEYPPERLFESGLATGFGDDWLRIGPAVIGVDGGTGGRRAALFDPYANGKGASDRGSFRVDEDFLNEFCGEAQRRGFQIGAVAHGDRAISLTLDAIEKAMRNHPRKRNLRHRLEHAYLWREDLFDRAQKLGVVLASQPAIMRLYDRTQTIDAWGKERSAFGFPYRSALQAGVIATGGSDSPLITPNPMVGIAALVDRRVWDAQDEVVLGPNQALSLDEALRVYTYNGAYADHAEDQFGSVEVGKYADLVLLDRDLARTPTEELEGVTAEQTYVAGKQVFLKD